MSPETGLTAGSLQGDPYGIAAGDTSTRDPVALLFPPAREIHNKSGHAGVHGER